MTQTDRDTPVTARVQAVLDERCRCGKVSADEIVSVLGHYEDVARFDPIHGTWWCVCGEPGYPHLATPEPSDV
jgi:hypothetical protein